MSYVRTYNHSVRVGNWQEDVVLEEDTIKDFLDRRERGELSIQKTSKLRDGILAAGSVSTSCDGNVHFGDIVQIISPTPKNNNRPGAALSINLDATQLNFQKDLGQKCQISGSANLSANSRNLFMIISCDGSQNGDALKYQQDFMLRTASGCLFLESDRQSFNRSAKKSRHNLVQLVDNPSELTRWRAVFFDPLFRLEMSGKPVRGNEKCLFQHCMTNANLNLESEHIITTAFGKDFEISGHSSYDSHKAEVDTNIWQFNMNVPGGPPQL